MRRVPRSNRGRVWSRGRHRWPALAAAIGLALAWGCRSRAPTPEGGTGSVPRRVLEALHSSPPSELVFEGIEEYVGERLYDYMNGAAATYLECGFAVMAACDVLRGADRARVEVYEMSAEETATALYAESAAGSERVLEAGEAGCYWSGFEPEGLFRHGRFLVRVYGYPAAEGEGPALVARVAAAVDGALRDAASPVP
ncbi:MAG: hypothetical protein JXR77_14975 [Lentisphaeria bacterium]|nr:hypothetical protein [Lentisphaeria bacterium]